MLRLHTILLLFCLFNTPYMTPVNKHTLLCLGDSYTIGEAVEENERFPMQAVELLRAQGIEFATPQIIAKTGWTTDELADAITQSHITGNYNFVTLLIGVNNQYRGRDTENYRQQFVQLLNTAIAYANGNRNHVFVISIPDWGVTPFGHNDARGEKTIGEQIDQYNSVNRYQALQAGVHYIDITPGSRLAKTDAALLAGDGLHPSGKMYAAWAQQLAQGIRQALNQ